MLERSWLRLVTCGVFKGFVRGGIIWLHSSAPILGATICVCSSTVAKSRLTMWTGLSSATNGGFVCSVVFSSVCD
jgi:hypothetical protein